ncbi:hypothetical protein NWF24_34120 [Variovorax paradoxus]|uniref:hypothetical protein n=1 Tax=Variovorax paradoxus TaxID=34073 RepID=UPI0021AB9D78|nr:hypothetical protein [Variovorax paradoxus]UVH57811.1 hypothetical protein NWF24_34120 [Variovorax paradoxus]
MRVICLYGVVATALAFGCYVNASAQAKAAADQPCVEVTVNGERTPSYDCLTEKLRPAASARAPDAAQPGMASEAMVQKPSNQLGLFNRAATGHRMGNTFGTSVYPQRPPTVAPSSPLIPRP